MPSYFGEHERRKKLDLVYSGVTRHTMDFSVLSIDLALNRQLAILALSVWLNPALILTSGSCSAVQIINPTFYDTSQPDYSTITKNGVYLLGHNIDAMKAYVLFGGQNLEYE